MSSIGSIVIVGASLAGANAAHELRRQGYDGRVALVGAEPHLPYERPPLSKGVLTGAATPESTSIWAEAAYIDAGIDLVLGAPVESIDPRARRVELDGGRWLRADRVLICTGARARRPMLPGADLDGVHVLRDLDHASALAEEIAAATSVVVIGGGFIGAEVAAAAIELGCATTMVELARLPLQRVLGPDVGGAYARLHRSRGVDVRLGARVERIVGNRRCTAVELGDGTEVAADVVVLGVGAVPNTGLAETAGIHVDDGIVVDAGCRTSIPEVFAGGDVARRPSSFVAGTIRPESWQNGQNQGIHAARAMLGDDTPFDDVPWFWSDQYDVNLQVTGFVDADAESVWRGDPGDLSFAVFSCRGGVVRGAVGMDRPRDVRGAQELIKHRVVIDPAQLVDPEVDLRRLARSERV